MASDQGIIYLNAGRQAVNYVKSKLKLGPANNPFKLQSTIAGQLRAMDAILKVWRKEDDLIDSQFVNPTDTLRMAQVFADSAEGYGAGNCGEHSAVAYLWLRRNSIFPIDWVHFNNKDHAFVLIGRPATTSTYTPKQIPQQPWFSDAVVCDAYWGRCDFWSNVLAEYNPQNMLSLLHQESQELHQWINK
jgi:hypothetical protein